VKLTRFNPNWQIRRPWWLFFILVAAFSVFCVHAVPFPSLRYLWVIVLFEIGYAASLAFLGIGWLLLPSSKRSLAVAELRRYETWNYLALLVLIASALLGPPFWPLHICFLIFYGSLWLCIMVTLAARGWRHHHQTRKAVPRSTS
jgi:hypothetical protein